MFTAGCRRVGICLGNKIVLVVAAHADDVLGCDGMVDRHRGNCLEFEAADGFKLLRVME